LGIGAVAAVAAVVALGGKGRRGVDTAVPAVINESTPMPVLVKALRESDGRALSVLYQKLTLKDDAPVPPMTADEAAGWVEALNGMRGGFLRFGSYGRSTALTIVGRVFRRLGASPTPANWTDALRPSHELLTAGLADAHVDVRVAGLVEIGSLWSWVPLTETAPTPSQETMLAEWKDGFHAPTLRRLADREPKARASAVACLGRHPIRTAAAPAVAYLEDPQSPEVRKQVLVSFAGRPDLLTDDMALRHMYDKEAGIPLVSEMVLKARGLNPEQISLGGMIFHPKADIRASVIPLIKGRTDIDPVVWLLHLSRDDDENVRLGAIDALSASLTPEVSQRIAEMAATDRSPAVRRAAGKFLPEAEKTAALPPLPGSPNLNPKAN
jgi:hypothetical protein